MIARSGAAPGEDDFQALFHNAGVGVTLVDATSWRFLRVNEMYTAITGRSEADLLRSTVPDITHPDDWLADYHHVGRLTRGEVPFYSVEKRLIRPDRSTVWVRVNAHPVRDAAGRVARTVSVVEDIGRRKAAERALQASEAELRLALEASAAGVWSYDPATDVTTWDATVMDLYGHDPTLPASHRRWLDTLHPADRPEVERQLHLMVHTPGHDGWDMEFRSIRPDGSVAWHHGLGRAERNPDGLMTRLTGIDLDITSRKAAEVAAQETAHRLQMVMETAGASSWVYDPATGLVSIDGTIPTGLGLSPGASVPLDLLLVNAPLDIREEAAAVLDQIIAGTSDAWSIDYHLDAPDGERRWYRCDVRAKRDPSGDLSWTSAISVETTELVTRNQQLRELASQLVMAEQQVREQIAQTLHDHLQQLLYSAAVTLDRLTANVDHDEAAAGLLAQTRSTIAEAIDAARTLSSELFPPELHDHGLPVALVHLIRQVRLQHHIDVEVSIEHDADPSAQDKRIFVYEAARELLFNAIKHAGAAHHELVLESTADGRIRLTVSDDGIGFHPDAPPEASGRQRGLGLMRLRQRVPLIPGQLEFHSEPGRGTRVVLEIPR